jgi:steroid delta-isomerase-like uncharacterized protein
MNTDEMKQMTRRYAEELFGQGKLEVADQIFAADYVNLDPTTPGGCVKGIEGMKQLVRGYRVAFPDLTFTVQGQWAEGDVVVTRWHAKGTHRGPLMGIPATGRAPEMPTEGVTISTFRGGKIVEQRAVWDALGLLRGLGIIPS